ncbi:hypothetical protein AYO20_10556 [Fonsecaea nubica]|uniref:Xylanolytic transcriptional activator regulatory domain-containing protein n=1 Tax=Fonsecaea nubica TaxID=856822 RepID=A0A178C7M6_9EURO|nr:hypothetical protein AYO20_10556 [Fonsecaea nubica]OAL24953.1 hypothetical protein AYO20_10556 [Fonsecaea nubica]
MSNGPNQLYPYHADSVFTARLVELEDEIQKLRQELKSVSQAAKGIPADDSSSLRSPELSRPPVNDSDSLPNEDTQTLILQSFTPTQREKQDHTTDISRSGRLLNTEQPTPSASAFSVPPVVPDNGRTVQERESSEAEPEIDYMHYQHLNAPVTAVQSMGSMSPASEKALHSAGLDDGSIHYGQTEPALTEVSAPSSVETSDVVLDIFKDESQARLLFASYFEGGNPYLPMFDPVVDTFDSIRARSPFCLIAILFIALKQKSGIVHKVTTDLQKTVREACLQEARRQVCDSIFESPTLESVQAMTLLAANAEKSWFAIGHAHEMALELGLDYALDELLSADSLTTDRAHFHSGSRRARTWLILYHIERELAVGTARKPRIRQLDTALLRHYLDLPVSYPSDMRFVATVEIVQLRSDIQRQIENTTSLSAISESAPREFERKAQEWFQYWDGRFKAYNVNEDSLNRISLRTQKNYSAITICCTILGRLHKNIDTYMLPTMDEIVRRTAETVSDQLCLIEHSKSYRWHFRWAPTYSALMLTFVVVLALQLAQRWPTYLEKSRTERRVRSVIGLLETHPYQNLAFQVKRMLDRSADEHLSSRQRNSTMSGEYSRQNASSQISRQHNPLPENNAPARIDDDSGTLLSNQCRETSVAEAENLDWLSGGSILENWTLLELGNSSPYDMSMFSGVGAI